MGREFAVLVQELLRQLCNLVGYITRLGPDMNVPDQPRTLLLYKYNFAFCLEHLKLYNLGHLATNVKTFMKYLSFPSLI
jgi:hypothetical protein